MKQTLLFILFLGFFSASAQEDALVFFIDKPNVEASLADPQSILSQEALDRKNQYGIVIDARDVPVSESYISSLKNTAGILVLSKSKWMNAAFVRGSQENINALLELDFVSGIEFSAKELNVSASQINRVSKFFVENQTRTNYNYGDALNQTEMIAAEVLHQQDFTGDGMIIAIMDSGFPNIADNPAFSGLIGENRLLGTYDFVNRQENVDGTGTHGALTLSNMAGTIDVAFVGTAPQASYYLFRTEFAPTENPVEEAWWVEALERADSLGVDVVNTSLGYRFFDNPTYDHSFEDLDGQTTIAARGANIAFEKGMLVVTSAGNDGSSDFKTVATPADAPGVLTIGAVDFNGDYAQFSSVGPTVDGRIKPDVVAQGQSAAVINTSGEVDFVNGTSFSSPIVAGAVACLWQALPELNNAEIMQLIRESASQSENPTNELGYGIPDFGKALRNASILKIQDKLAQEQFLLQENPVENWVIFSLPEAILEGNVQFYDLLGQQVLEAKIRHSTNQINVSHLSKGIYIAKVSGGGRTDTFKVIKR